MDFLELKEFAIRAACKAGQYIKSKYQGDFAILSKSDQKSQAAQILTEVDIQAQKLIYDELRPTLHHIGFLSEETPDDSSRFEKDYFWCIDPIDGTLAFSQGTPGFSVSIALVSKDGEPELAVVFDPGEEKLYWAHKGRGHSFQVPSKKETQEFTLYSDPSFASREDYDKIVETLKKYLFFNGQTKLVLARPMGAVMNVCHLLEKGHGIYFKPTKKCNGGGSLWDFAAVTLFCRELGFQATDFSGNKLELNRKDSTFLGHRGVLFYGPGFIPSDLHHELKQFS